MALFVYAFWLILVFIHIVSNVLDALLSVSLYVLKKERKKEPI